MLKLENTEVLGWEHAIRGMRNPMNSWEKSDSEYGCHLTKGRDSIISWDHHEEGEEYRCSNCSWCSPLCEDDFDPEYSKHVREYIVGPNDLDLMKRLRNAGTDHRKFMRMIVVYLDITAPLYWWKEFKTYRNGKRYGDEEPDIFPIPDDYLEYDIEMNSCSTMHKIAAKEFTLEDFSHEHLDDEFECVKNPCADPYEGDFKTSIGVLLDTIEALNWWRNQYLHQKEINAGPERLKWCWWQMIQLLPSSYNQKRTVMLNYEVLANMYKSRKGHRLDEWGTFCDWIESLPYSELITGKEK